MARTKRSDQTDAPEVRTRPHLQQNGRNHFCSDNVSELVRPSSDSPLLTDVVLNENVYLMLDLHKSFGNMDGLQAGEVQFNHKAVHMVRGFQKIDGVCNKELALSIAPSLKKSSNREYIARFYEIKENDDHLEVRFGGSRGVPHEITATKKS